MPAARTRRRLLAAAALLIVLGGLAFTASARLPAPAAQPPGRPCLPARAASRGLAARTGRWCRR